MNVIEVKNLHKKFCLDLKTSLRYGLIDSYMDVFGMLKNSKKLREKEFWALQNISFELKKGESIGVVGRNGSGKTTLLKLLHNLLDPSWGEININGTLRALIALGTGFNPVLTGRENIKIACKVLGFSDIQIGEMTEEILEFSEIGDFIDTPVRNYSSGMLVRLGFAVAIQMKPDILLIDEVLAVGDIGFTVKCQKKITDFRNNGGSIILVSHGLHNIRFHCDNAIWINKSKMMMSGDANLVCDEYETFTQKGMVEINDPLIASKQVELKDVLLKEKVDQKEKFKFEAIINSKKHIDEPIFEFTVADAFGNPIIQRFSNIDGYKFKILKGSNKIIISFDSLPIKPGIYNVTFIMSEKELNNHLIYCYNSFRFEVKSSDTKFGILDLKPYWNLD